MLVTKCCQLPCVSPARARGFHVSGMLPVPTTARHLWHPSASSRRAAFPWGPSPAEEPGGNHADPQVALPGRDSPLANRLVFQVDTPAWLPPGFASAATCAPVHLVSRGVGWTRDNPDLEPPTPHSLTSSPHTGPSRHGLPASIIQCRGGLLLLVPGRDEGLHPKCYQLVPKRIPSSSGF